METIDIILLIPIAYFGFRGFQSGIIKELLSIAGLIIAVFLTLNYLEPVSAYFMDLINYTGDFNPFIAGILLFIGTLILTNIIIYFISKLIKAANLSWANKLIGMSFGILKSGILVSSILILLSGFNLPDQQTVQKSIGYPILIKFAPTTYNIIAKIYPGADDFTETIKKTIDKNNPLNNFNF